jgi:hypothetical protein
MDGQDPRMQVWRASPSISQVPLQKEGMENHEGAAKRMARSQWTAALRLVGSQFRGRERVPLVSFHLPPRVPLRARGVPLLPVMEHKNNG